uniref:Membrane protein DAP10 n=1 Tax=Neogobius melanostomus TaxID=47308 RepID=A0A8C6SJC8_9GOBI
ITDSGMIVIITHFFVFPVSCYKLEPGTVAGIISVDVILTLLIVTATYYCARKQRQKTERGKALCISFKKRVKIK